MCAKKIKVGLFVLGHFVFSSLPFSGGKICLSFWAGMKRKVFYVFLIFSGKLFSRAPSTLLVKKITYAKPIQEVYQIQLPNISGHEWSCEGWDTFAIGSPCNVRTGTSFDLNSRTTKANYGLVFYLHSSVAMTIISKLSNSVSLK